MRSRDLDQNRIWECSLVHGRYFVVQSEPIINAGLTELTWNPLLPGNSGVPKRSCNPTEAKTSKL